MATDTTIVREAPEVEAYKLGLLKEAKSLIEQPVSLPAVQAAGLSPYQEGAMNLAAAGLGSYVPYIQEGSQQISDAFDVTRQTADQLAGMDVNQMFAPAQAFTASAAQSFSPEAAAYYMNPYMQAVTQNALGEMRRQADIAAQQNAAQAVQAGAFGSTREGVQRAMTERDVQDLMQQKIMQDYAQNYAQAAQMFQEQQQRQLNVGSQLGSQAGAMGQLGLGKAQGIGSLSSQLGQLGVQQAALGQTASQLGLQDVNMLTQLGAIEQQAKQAELDALRQTQLQETMMPYQQLSFLSDIYKGAPGSQMTLTSQTAPTSSPLQTALGLGIGTLSAVTGANKAGLF